jgi:MFS superfamily sulfate permease-like transporter
VPKLLGFSVEGDSVLDDVRGLATGLADGEVDGLAAVFGVASLIVLIVLSAWWRRAGAMVVVVVTSMVVVAIGGWSDDLPVVGELPSGLPSPALGGLSWGDVGSLVAPAFGIALIAFTDTSVLSRVFAARQGARVSGSDEMRAIGLSNLATGALSGFPVSGSSSRTPVAEQAGGHTQLVGVVGALSLVVFVLAAPGLMRYLPSAVLAAVVMVAASSLADAGAVVRLARVDRVDAALSVAAFLGVVLIGVLQGIVIAIALSLVAFVNQAWRPYRAELGRRAGVRGYHDLARHPEGERLDDIVIVRFDAPLFFANASLFSEWVRSRVAERTDARWVVLAAEPITSVDSTAVEELVRLDDSLAKSGIQLVIAEMKGPVKDDLERRGLGDRFGPERFAPTVGAAVDRILGHERDDIGHPSDRS